MSCTKVRHASQRSARVAAKRIGIASLDAYKCPACHQWHLGNQRDLAAARIDQLLAETARRDASRTAPIVAGNVEIASEKIR